MAMLLNRKYGTRLECLYYILKSRYTKYGLEQEFNLKDFKYDSDDLHNVHNYCNQLKNIMGRKFCPYLINPLNESKCYATQSVISDSTKSKAVSDVGGSLEALGFLKRDQNRFKITKEGEKWVNTDFFSREWGDIALRGVLSYGPLIGFLYKIKELPEIFNYSEIYLGYPKTEEIVSYINDKGEEEYILLSTDSMRDSVTRTTSKIIGWCVTVGLLDPIGINSSESDFPHIKYQDFANADELTVRNFKKTDLYKRVIMNNIYVQNPLSYKRLHKNVASIRERGSDDLRNITLKYNQKILDRRFVLIYALNKKGLQNSSLDFNKLLKAMYQYKELFFTDNNDPSVIMESESEIADLCGIPFLLNKESLIPLTTINEAVLIEDASNETIEIANKIIRIMEEL